MVLRDYEQRFQYLREPIRRATEAYESGMRNFDQMKELILIEFGLLHTSNMFHRTAHWFGEQWDILGDIAHQRHIIQDFGSTPAFNALELDMDAFYTRAMEIFIDIDKELKALINICDENGGYALARQVENLQVENSKKHEEFLNAWKMYEEATSPTSYDSWVKSMLENEEA